MSYSDGELYIVQVLESLELRLAESKFYFILEQNGTGSLDYELEWFRSSADVLESLTSSSTE